MNIARWMAGLVMVVACTMACAGEKTQLRVLLLSGKNNHNWRETTPLLKAIYDQSGRFVVDVCEAPETMTAPVLAKYDVVVSNWTNWPDVNKRVWGEETEKAFLNYIQDGKGFVAVHAAGSVFYNWPEYQELVGSWWKMGQTGHGPVHAFLVKIADANHPITQGMKEFEITDELWHKQGTAGELKILCSAFSDKAKGGSGQEEPVLHWRSCGKGRGVNLGLGHDGRALRAEGFQVLLLRATEWAATGSVTIPSTVTIALPMPEAKKTAK